MEALDQICGGIVAGLSLLLGVVFIFYGEHLVAWLWGAAFIFGAVVCAYERSQLWRRDE